MRQNVAHEIRAHLQGQGETPQGSTAQAHELEERVADRGRICAEAPERYGCLPVAGNFPAEALCVETKVAGNSPARSGARSLALRAQKFMPSDACGAGFLKTRASLSQRGVALLQGALQLRGALRAVPETFWRPVPSLNDPQLRHSGRVL